MNAQVVDQGPVKKPMFPSKHYLALYQLESRSGKDSGRSSAGAHGPMQIMPIAFKDLQEAGLIDKKATYEDVANDPDLNMKAGIMLSELNAKRYPALKNNQANALAYLKGGAGTQALIDKYGSIANARAKGALSHEEKKYMDNYNFQYYGIEELKPFKENLAYKTYRVLYPGYEEFNELPKKNLGALMAAGDSSKSLGVGADDVTGGLVPFTKIVGTTDDLLTGDLAEQADTNPTPMAPNHGLGRLDFRKAFEVLPELNRTLPNEVKSITPQKGVAMSYTKTQKDEDGKHGDGSSGKGWQIAGGIGNALGSLVTTAVPAAMSIISNMRNQYNLEEEQDRNTMKATTYTGSDRGFTNLISMDTGGAMVKVGPAYMPLDKRKSVDLYELGGNKKINKPVPVINPAPAQTVKDELILHADGSLTGTAAKKKDHSEMKSTDVTDTLNVEQFDEQGNIINPGSYVFSNSKKLGFTKDIADKIIIGITPSYYQEGKKAIPPKVINFGEMVYNKKDKELTPAEMTKNVMKKYKVVEGSNDIFERAASEANKKSRGMLVDVIKGINDLGKKAAEGSDQADADAVQSFGYGGKPKVKRYDDGGDAQFDKAFKLLEDYYGNLNTNKYSFYPVAGSLGSMAVQTALSSFQDPISRAPEYSSALIGDAFKPINISVMDRALRTNLGKSESNRIRAMENMGVSESRAANMLSRDSNVDVLNTQSVQAYLRNAALGQEEAKYRLGVDEKLAQWDDRNKTAQNQFVANLSNVWGSGIQSAANAMFNAGKFSDQMKLNTLAAMSQTSLAKASYDKMKSFMPQIPINNDPKINVVPGAPGTPGASGVATPKPPVSNTPTPGNQDTGSASNTDTSKDDRTRTTGYKVPYVSNEAFNNLKDKFSKQNLPHIDKTDMGIKPDPNPPSTPTPDNKPYIDKKDMGIKVDPNPEDNLTTDFIQGPSIKDTTGGRLKRLNPATALTDRDPADILENAKRQVAKELSNINPKDKRPDKPGQMQLRDFSDITRKPKKDAFIDDNTDAYIKPAQSSTSDVDRAANVIKDAEESKAIMEKTTEDLGKALALEGLKTEYQSKKLLVDELRNKQITAKAKGKTIDAADKKKLAEEEYYLRQLEKKIQGL